MVTVLPSPPPVEYIALALLFYIGGLVTPWYFAQERMRGFGRWLATRIPYRPPPGEETGKAMERAVEAGEASLDEEER